MAEPTNPPGERRLAHPPSDRYRSVVTDDAEVGPAAPNLAAADGSAAGRERRGPALGVIAALAGAAGITVLGGLATVTAGLVVVAAATGWTVGNVLPGRSATAVTLALASVALGQAGLWGYALAQGGVLGPLDLLWQVYGGLLPLEFAAAAIFAWMAAR